MADGMLTYVGTYNSSEDDSIFIYRLDPDSGALTAVDAISGVSNPSFLALHPQYRYLYAVAEISEVDGQSGGGVAAFSIDPETGALTPLNQQSSVGTGPCHLSVDATGQVVLVANYGGGSVTALPLSADGSLGEATAFIQHGGSSANPQRQEGPHAHSIMIDPGNRYAFAPDLGIDQVVIYRLDPDQGTLTPNDPPWATVPAGEGPRHFAFHPSGRYAYVITELLNSVVAFAYDGDGGVLTELQRIPTLPAGFDGTSYCADIHVHPNGRFVYGSNRGHDSIVIYAIDESTGQLSLVGHESTQGEHPRNFAIDPTGHFLLAANQSTDNIVIFRIDESDGTLTPTGQVVEAPKPVCIKIIP